MLPNAPPKPPSPSPPPSSHPPATLSAPPQTIHPSSQAPSPHPPLPAFSLSLSPSAAADKAPPPSPPASIRDTESRSSSRKLNPARKKPWNVEDMWEDASDSEEETTGRPDAAPAPSDPHARVVEARDSFEHSIRLGQIDEASGSSLGNKRSFDQGSFRSTHAVQLDRVSRRDSEHSLDSSTAGFNRTMGRKASLHSSPSSHRKASSYVPPSPPSLSAQSQAQHPHSRSDSAQENLSPDLLGTDTAQFAALPSVGGVSNKTDGFGSKANLIPAPDPASSDLQSSFVLSRNLQEDPEEALPIPQYASETLHTSIGDFIPADRSQQTLLRPPMLDGMNRRGDSRSMDEGNRTPLPHSSDAYIEKDARAQTLSPSREPSLRNSFSQPRPPKTTELEEGNHSLSPIPSRSHERSPSSGHGRTFSEQNDYRAERRNGSISSRCECSPADEAGFGNTAKARKGAPDDASLASVGPTPTMGSNPDTETLKEPKGQNHPSPSGDEPHVPYARISDPRESEVEETSRSSTVSQRMPFSIWDYLQEELYTTDYDAASEHKVERVSNFFKVPFRVEELILFGFVACFDAFLYSFTIIPLRFAIAMGQAVRNAFVRLRGAKEGQSKRLSASHKCDIMKIFLLVLACSLLALSKWNDAGKMYHSVRGQDLIKLYVIFNVLEIADKLGCSIGQDVLDSLFSRSTLARRADGSLPYVRVVGLFLLALGYIILHTLILSYQMVALNVAINSYDHSLMSLLISNQFVEIKGSVFKKFEKENLFQIACADIVERFQLFLMVCFIGVRNLVEVAGFHGADALPSSSALSSDHWWSPVFRLLPSYTVLERTLFPAAIVLLSEVLVDWMKHAFITKFNHIRPSVYGRYIDVLCRDLLMGSPAATDPPTSFPSKDAPDTTTGAPTTEPLDTAGQPYKGKGFNAVDAAHAPPRRSTFVDQAPIVSRRLGFAPLPLACLMIQVIIQIAGMLRSGTESFEDIFEASDPLSPHAGNNVSAGTAGLWDRTVVPILTAVTAWMAALLTALVAWTFLVGIKVVLGMNLVSYAEHRWFTAAERAEEEGANGRSRAPIGMHPHEVAYEKTTRTLLDRAKDNAPNPPLHGAAPAGAASVAGSSNKKRTPDLLDVGRYTMVRSRIW